MSPRIACGSLATWSIAVRNWSRYCAPSWRLATLASPEHDDFLRHLYGDIPARWDDKLRGYDRLRVIVNACTRLRFCAADDTMDFGEKRGATHAPEGFAPW